MEIRIKVIRVYINSGVEVCLLIDNVIINVLSEIITTNIRYDIIGSIIASNRYSDVGLIPSDI